jgi:hypothetical protein
MVAIPEGHQGYPIANPSTETDADGAFVMSTYMADDGVPAGKYTVTVLPPGAGGADADEEEDPDAKETSPSQGNAKVPAKYQDPKTSTLTATVEPSAENHFTFELD